MLINQCLLTKNDCYGSSIITPKGIIVHSTGANNPNLKRYVQPDDGRLGTNPYKNDWNRSGLNTCVHAFIGKDKYGNVTTYQTLPWSNCAWGVGKGRNGSYNYSPTGYIQFEICEDSLTDLTYFHNAFTEAANLCAYLCKKYNIPVSRVISHHEAYVEGYASNHADCDHWLRKFNKDMNWFRRLVEAAIEAEDVLTMKEPVPEVKEYVTAVKGDSLSRIAKNNGLTLKQIKELNPEVKAPLYIIRVGQKVRIK